MCSLSAGKSVGRGVGCRAAPGCATTTAPAELLAAAALPVAAPVLGPVLGLGLLAADRAAGLAGLALRSSRSAVGCVKACAPVAAVAATTRVNRVLAGIRITTRRLKPVCRPGVQTNTRAFHSWKQGANGKWRKACPGFPSPVRRFCCPKSLFFVALGLQEAIK